MDNAKEVIDKRGASYWAKALGCPLSTVRSWRDRGIPAYVIADNKTAARKLRADGYKRDVGVMSAKIPPHDRRIGAEPGQVMLKRRASNGIDAA